MFNFRILQLGALSILLSLVVSMGTTYSEESNLLQFEIKYTNGDRIDAYQTTYKVYQDYDKTPIIEKELETNPETISLPINHKYKVEVYVNGMYSEVGYAELKESSEKLNINIPLPGGLKFHVFFEDGETPIENAVVKIKSHHDEIQRIGNTDENGDTMRYWLQSTSLPNDYYVADVYYDEFLLTSVSNIKLQQGISQEQKIVVPIPDMVEELIIFRLFDTSNEKILNDDDLSILIEHHDGQKFTSSQMNDRGEIYFSDIPSGIYSVSVIKDKSKQDLWPETKIAITGNQNEFDLIQENPVTPITEPESTSSTEEIIETPGKQTLSSSSEPIVYVPSKQNYQLTCNCVSFRLDGVQDYWLNEVQYELINLFSKNNIPLTAGVIIDSFGNDPYLVSLVKKEIGSHNLEIANHGLDSKPFTVFDKQKQSELLEESNKKIFEKLNVSPKIFIPPENRFNEDTKSALIENGFTHLSASMLNDSPPFSLKDETLYRFPAVTTTGEYVPSQNRILGIDSETTYVETLEGIDKYGFAVITIHPQEFAIYEGGTYQNKINSVQLNELESLIDSLASKNIKIVFLGDINKNIRMEVQNTPNSIAPYSIPSWIKNNAGWWRDGNIDDSSFLHGIEFLIKEGILQIPPTTQGTGGSEIPPWIKENAGWWAEGKISDDDFIYGVNFLVNQGIIIVDV
ncbi:MAG: DUF2334 domain-containing protein [Nitrosopumilaceae archaeon]|jgi:peptidoglycan/xylan/chitin deacetylase (PgdA/CDA1 family)